MYGRTMAELWPDYGGICGAAKFSPDLLCFRYEVRGILDASGDAVTIFREDT